MAISPKILAQTRPSAGVLTDHYTCPASTKTTTTTIAIHNTSSTEDTFKITVAPSGAADATVHELYGGAACPGNETITITIGVTLNATDKIRVHSTNGTLNFHTYGIEES